MAQLEISTQDGRVFVSDIRGQDLREPPKSMSRWVIFTDDGIPAWYGPDEIDGAEWVEDLPVDAAALRRVNGRWEPRRAPLPPSEEEIGARIAALLTQQRDSALEAVDEMIQTARLRFVTPLAGQEAIYLSKEAEARLYVTTVPEPSTLEDFPYLAGEVGITAPSALALARMWMQRGALFRSLGARTENLRMTARKAIRTADNREAVEAALQGLAARLDALG